MVWEERWSNGKQRKYYFNAETGESVWERPEAMSTGTVHCYHILCKHAQSRRPSSHRTAAITITAAEAVATLERLRPTIKTLEDFKKVAREYSDCSSARSGGDLGDFGRGQMQAPFEEAAFGLGVGEMSGVVRSESGVHLIWRAR